MKTQLLKSGMAFLIFNAAILISAEAQIVYTDVVPDMTVSCSGNCSAYYDLDLNLDGIKDFKISNTTSLVQSNQCQTATNELVNLTPLNNNSVVINSAYNYTLALNINSLIDTNSQTWSNTASYCMSGIFHWGCYKPMYWTWLWHIGYCGSWTLNSDKYLGLKFLIGNTVHYGWARINLIRTFNQISFTIKDYAYNSIPNQPILAGQTGTTGITENNSSNHLSIYPNPATNSITIKIPSDEGGEIQIVNLFGCMVETRNCASLRDNELQIDVSKFPAGMYLARWNSRENYQTQKFSVAK